MGFRVIAIDTGSEEQDMCLNTLSAEEFVDFAQGYIVANGKSVTGGLGAHAVILERETFPTSRIGRYILESLRLKKLLDN